MSIEFYRDLARCPDCLGWGFRVETAPGSTVNPVAASENDFMSGRHILCHCQQPEFEDAAIQCLHDAVAVFEAEMGKGELK